MPTGVIMYMLSLPLLLSLPLSLPAPYLFLCPCLPSSPFDFSSKPEPPTPNAGGKHGGRTNPRDSKDAAHGNHASNCRQTRIPTPRTPTPEAQTPNPDLQRRSANPDLQRRSTNPDLQISGGSPGGHPGIYVKTPKIGFFTVSTDTL